MQDKQEQWNLADQLRRRNLALRDREFIKTIAHWRVGTRGRQETTYVSVVIGGNNDGWVSYGLGKGVDAEESVLRAELNLHKNAVFVPRTPWHGLPHAVRGKHNSTVVDIRPRPLGSGLVGSMFMYRLMEMAGLEDASAKINGPRRNIIGVIHAVWDALKQLRSPRELAMARGKVIHRELDPGYIQDIYPGPQEREARDKRIQRLLDAVADNSKVMRSDIRTKYLSEARGFDEAFKYGDLRNLVRHPNWGEEHENEQREAAAAAAGQPDEPSG